MDAAHPGCYKVPMKNLRCIVYVSSATHELTTAHLEALLTDSRTYNHEHQVTGVAAAAQRTQLHAVLGGRQ